MPKRSRGRPKKALSEPEAGHNVGTATAESRMNSGRNTSALALHAVAPLAPRLLDLHATAAYLGVSEWTVRDLEAAGLLQRVRVPLPNQGELRKLLFDRQDLDRCVEMWKEGSFCGRLRPHQNTTVITRG